MSAPFTVQDKCRLEADEACYVLSIESAVPIFTVAIQCSAPLQMLDVPSNVAILSRSPPDEANGNLTLATYRYTAPYGEGVEEEEQGVGGGGGGGRGNGRHGYREACCSS